MVELNLNQTIAAWTAATMSMHWSWCHSILLGCLSAYSSCLCCPCSSSQTCPSFSPFFKLLFSYVQRTSISRHFLLRFLCLYQPSILLNRCFHPKLLLSSLSLLLVGSPALLHRLTTIAGRSAGRLATADLTAG